MSELGDLLFAVHESLEQAGIPHAVGGAIALAYCTLDPRGTRDLDFNVFVGPERARDVFAALPDGVEVSGERLERLERDGQVRLRSGTTPVDLFLSVLPFHDDVAEHVEGVATTFGGDLPDRATFDAPVRLARHLDHLQT